jgi:hypothetical protein
MKVSGFSRRSEKESSEKTPEESSSRSILKKSNDNRGSIPKKKVVFDGVHIPSNRNRKETSAAPSDKEKVPNAPSVNKPKETVEVELSDSEEDELLRAPLTERTLYEPDKGRPFDRVPPQILQRPKGKESAIVIDGDSKRPKDRSGTDRTSSTGREPRYRLRSELFREGLEEDVASKIFDGRIEVTAAEVAVLSPKIQKILQRKLQNKQVRPKKKEIFVTTLTEEGMEIEDLSEPSTVERYIDIKDLTQDNEDMFEVLPEDRDGLRAGSIVHKDIVQCFIQDLSPNDNRRDITIVARPSVGLRAVAPIINGRNEPIECILDPGSQIVSIDRLIAGYLDLQWDPGVTVKMQDAHGSTERTLGLARNVPFKFGEVTVYLQLHVQNRAPYHVLLGRPFDVLTETEIRNFGNGEQELTITDPNSGHKCSMSTYPRGQIASKLDIDTSRYNEQPKLVSEERPPNASSNVNFRTSRI